MSEVSEMKERVILPLVTRRLTTEDGGRLFDFYESLSEQTRAIFGKYKFTKDYAEQLAAESVDRTCKRQFVLVDEREEAGEAIAGLSWFWMWDHKVPWFGIMISDRYQNRGVGQKLMEFMVEETRKHNKGGILLKTAKTNVRAQALYKRNGFTTIGEYTDGEMLMILNHLDTNG